MVYCVNKAMPIHLINSKCHNKQLQERKSHNTCLTNHTWSISHHIMLSCHWLLMPLGGEHTNMQTKAISRNQARWASGLRMPGLIIVKKWPGVLVQEIESTLSYSAIIGQGKYWQKVYLIRLVGKYLANAFLNETVHTYIINNYCFWFTWKD